MSQSTAFHPPGNGAGPALSTPVGPPLGKNADPDPPNLTARDVAPLLGMSYSTVLARAKSGELRCVKMGRTRCSPVRFRRSFVEQYIAAHTAGGTTIEAATGGRS